MRKRVMFISSLCFEYSLLVTNAARLNRPIYSLSQTIAQSSGALVYITAGRKSVVTGSITHRQLHVLYTLRQRAALCYTLGYFFALQILSHTTRILITGPPTYSVGGPD